MKSALEKVEQVREVSHINPAHSPFGEQFTQLEPDAMTVEDCDLVYALVRMRKPQLVIETGTGSGMATKRIAEAIAANGKGCLISCDTDRESVENAKRNMPKLYCSVCESTGMFLLRRVAQRKPEVILVDAGNAENRLEELRYIVEEDVLAEKGLLILHDAINPKYQALPVYLQLKDWPGFVLDGLQGIAVFQKP